MDRRHFLVSTGAAALAAGFAAAHASDRASEAAGEMAGHHDPALNEAFETIFNEAVDSSPELATSLGLDKGARAGLKAELSPQTPEERANDLARTRSAIEKLSGFDPAHLSPSAKLNREVVLYSLNQQTIAPETWEIDSAVRPYPVFQQGGAYFRTPDFLNTAHTIASKDDCDAYLARLSQFARNLDQDSAEQERQAARGFLAPGWSLDLTLLQMKKLRDQKAAESSLAKSLADRAAAAGVAGDWSGRAAKIIDKEIYPALERQIALIEKLRPTTKEGDGAARLPDGEAIYAAALKQMTTTDMSPDEVHALGLEQVADISKSLDKILKKAGLKDGAVGARLAALNEREEQLYQNTDEGRAALLASLNAGVEKINALLPEAFSTLPTQPLEIRRVPVEIQDGASNGYYNRAALDGSRPAIYFINLKDVKDWPKYTLPALTYHEGAPGHHLQISLAQESEDIPTLRKIGGFSAYSEGWALYAESLADELGAYEGIERAGFLQSFLFRAARLVVDTGLHSKGWGREQARDYLVSTTGFAQPRSQREVERYCTQIGQACSYKIGHAVWTRARKNAEKTLGKKFSVKDFHEILKEGAMPLTILEARIAERAKAKA